MDGTSSTPNAAQLVLDQLRASLDGSRYSLKAIYAAITISFGGAIVVLVIVFLLWHILREVYASQPLFKKRFDFFSHLRLFEKQEESKKNPFAYNAYSVDEEDEDADVRDVDEKVTLKKCLKSSWSCNEESMLETHGLDAAVYMRSLRMNRNLFGLLTLVLFLVAAPINIVYNLRRPYVVNLTHRDSLLLITPSLLSSRQMIPHVVLGWVANLIVFAILWYNYGKVISLRRRVMMSEAYQQDICNRTVMLTDVPKKLRSKKVLSLALSALSHSNETPQSIYLGVRPERKLESLILEHAALVRRYENSCACKAHEDVSSAKVYVEEKMNDPQAVQLRQDIFHLERVIARHRAAGGQEFNSYAFASFGTVRVAHSTVQPTKSYALNSFSAVNGLQSLDSCGLRMAPPPEHIVWENLKLTPAERGSKQLMVNTLYGVLLLFWIVPSAFIGCFLSNLSRLANVWPAFGRAMDAHPTLFAILQGFLSPTITTLVFATLPLLFRRMSHLQGKITRVEREQEVLRKLYAFFFLDNFFVFTLIGVVWDIVAQVLQQTHAAKVAGQSLTFHEVWVTLDVAQRIATAIVNISSFWVMYVLRGIFGLFAGSAQPITLVKRFFSYFTGNVYRQTPRQKAENAMPEPFQYAVNFLSVLFYTTVALGFTTIQPLVLPTTFLLFTFSVPVKKYELCHMQITKYESNGAYYPLVNDVILFATAFGNLMLFCVVWVQAGWRIAMGCAPLAASVIIYKIICWFKFDRPFHMMGLELPSPESFDGRSATNLHLASVNANQSVTCYEDPQMGAPLEKPVLTFEDAILHCGKCHPEATSEENPFEEEGHVYPSGYTPVEPYPAYRSFT